MMLGELKSLLAGPEKKYSNLVFFDTETTGVNPDKGDRIIDLAFIAVRKDGQIRQEDVYVQLPEGQTIPEKIVRLTGITDMALLGGISEKRAAELFAGMITKDTLLIAHNAQFDISFVAYMFMRYMKEHPEWISTLSACDYLDTLTVYKDRRPYPHRLANAILAYGLQNRVRNDHRAINDVIALFEITKAMAEERNDLISYINIFGYNPKYGVAGKKLKKVRYQAQSYADGMKPLEATLPEVVRRIWPDRCGTA